MYPECTGHHLLPAEGYNMELQNQLYVTIERTRGQMHDFTRQRYPYRIETGSKVQPLQVVRVAVRRVSAWLGQSDETETALLAEPDCATAGC